MQPQQLVPRRIRELWQPDGWHFSAAAAVVVGMSAGIGVWIFKQMISLFEHGFGLLGEALAPFGVLAVVMLPVLGGLIVGLIVKFWVGEERHHGVAGIIESVALAGGRLRYWRVPAKVLGSSISIGSGAAVGPEDPSVQIGSNLGSLVGQRLHMSDERTRVLVAAGAAAGVSAAFNAPITGVFFAIEIILGQIGGSAMGIVLLASVVAAATTQAIVGGDPAFTVPVYHYNSPAELPLYVLLGLLAGPIAALYVHFLYIAQDVFHRMPLPNYLKPALAGLLVGLIAIWLPQIMGVGYPTIGSILNGDLTAAGLLAALAVAKLIATPISIGGGFLGGVFAPSLFIGASLGGAFGSLASRLLGGWALHPGAFAMVGMAAVLAGAIHAPLTAIMLLFEMTNDYRIILPLMLAVAVSMALSQWIQRDSVYTLGLTRKGIRIERGRDVEVLESLRVDEIMEKDVATAKENDTLTATMDSLMKTRMHGLPVVDGGGRLTGVISLQDIDRAQARAGEDHPAASHPGTGPLPQSQRFASMLVGDVCSRNLQVAYPDEPLDVALRRMSSHDIGRLPVVKRGDRAQLVGLLRRTHIVRAYEIALARRMALRSRAQQVRLGAVSGLDVVEVAVAASATAAGREVKDLGLADAIVIATLRRGRRVLVPRGSTVLEAGDVLAVVGDDAALEALRRLCTSTPH